MCRANVMDPGIGHLAAPIRRLFAHVLDILVPVVSIFMIFVMAAAGSAGNSAEGGGGGGAAFIGILLMIGYVLWALVLFSRGTTPGKRLLGIRVVREDGSPAGFFTMLIREWIGKAISSMVFSLGFIWILIDRDRQGWHDKLVSTFVVA
jgi:uncharacterized RDD family membrane protein YckC